MKNTIDSRLFSSLLALVILFFSSCDPCRDVVCLNGGTCDEGHCACPQGYEGADCSTVLKPTSMVIKKVQIFSFNPNWDPYDENEPDIVVTINPGNTANLSNKTLPEYNCAYGKIVTFGSESYPLYEIKNLHIDWTIGMWDFDSVIDYDWIGGKVFKPISYVTGFPSEIRLYNPNLPTTDIVLHVAWKF